MAWCGVVINSNMTTMPTMTKDACHRHLDRPLDLPLEARQGQSVKIIQTRKFKIIFINQDNSNKKIQNNFHQSHGLTYPLNTGHINAACPSRSLRRCLMPDAFIGASYVIWQRWHQCFRLLISQSSGV